MFFNDEENYMKKNLSLLLFGLSFIGSSGVINAAIQPSVKPSRTGQERKKSDEWQRNEFVQNILAYDVFKTFRTRFMYLEGALYRIKSIRFSKVEQKMKALEETFKAKEPMAAFDNIAEYFSSPKYKEYVAENDSIKELSSKFDKILSEPYFGVSPEHSLDRYMNDWELHEAKKRLWVFDHRNQIDEHFERAIEYLKSLLATLEPAEQQKIIKELNQNGVYLTVPVDQKNSVIQQLDKYNLQLNEIKEMEKKLPPQKRLLQYGKEFRSKYNATIWQIENLIGLAAWQADRYMPYAHDTLKKIGMKITNLKDDISKELQAVE